MARSVRRGGREACVATGNRRECKREQPPTPAMQARAVAAGNRHLRAGPPVKPSRQALPCPPVHRAFSCIYTMTPMYLATPWHHALLFHALQVDKLVNQRGGSTEVVWAGYGSGNVNGGDMKEVGV